MVKANITQKFFKISFFDDTLWEAFCFWMQFSSV